jgi:nitronate monooxygenase
VVSFTFGIVSNAVVERLHAAGAKVIGTATHVAEARAWESVGADAVCAQGAEAGGHRGTFLGGFEEAMIGTVALVPQVADAVRIPVIAAGGIVDGRGIAAALILGATGVQLGTAFLTCAESGIPTAWKNSLRAAADNGTRVTRVFSGRPARGLVNAFMERLRADEQAVPSYPVQNALTGEIRTAAKHQGRLDHVALWAGQGVPLVRSLPAAAELVRRLRDETEAALRKACRG